MESIKLSITCRKPLEAKYNQQALARINDTIAKWVAADAARGIRNVHLAVDDPSEMNAYEIAPVSGAVTPEKVKAVIDALVASLTPDYIVLIGSGDVVPLFDVPNPTLSKDDKDESVPTDNPYANSQRFNKAKRSTYLVPDRVVARIPDLPGSGDPAWLLDYLAVATKWKSRPASGYSNDLMVCCESWTKSGKACAEFLSRDANRMMICPPDGDVSKKLKGRHKALLQMIKCHGQENDSWFYGQKGIKYPEVLRSTSLEKRTKKGTVVGAMCCFGAQVFDPLDQASLHPNEPPISSVYLRQGAFGFLGSTCTAWVGDAEMMCADWVVASFPQSVLGGASLGRAALETKQNFTRWVQKQGDQLDAADEKTLIQFMLLGDPSIHPVMAALPAGLRSAAMLGAAPVESVAISRKQRRAVSHAMGTILTAAVPARRPVKKVSMPTDVMALARELTADVGDGFNFKLSSPVVHRVSSEIPQPELLMAPAMSLVTAGMTTDATEVVARKTLQYYWTARRDDGPVPDVRMVAIQTDPDGNVLRTQTLVSS